MRCNDRPISSLQTRRRCNLTQFEISLWRHFPTATLREKQTSNTPPRAPSPAKLAHYLPELLPLRSSEKRRSLPEEMGEQSTPSSPSHHYASVTICRAMSYGGYYSNMTIPSECFQPFTRATHPVLSSKEAQVKPEMVLSPPP